MVQLQSLYYLKHKSYDQTHAEPLAFGSNLVKSSHKIKHTTLSFIFDWASWTYGVQDSCYSVALMRKMGYFFLFTR